MAVDIPATREVVEHVFARQDVLSACRRRDLSMPIMVLGANDVTQAQIAALTGIPQGRISEYKTRKRTPTATSTYEAFADGLGLPPAARLALGLAPEGANSDSPGSAAGRPAATARAGLGDVRPLLSNLSKTSTVPVLSALRGMHRGYVEADRLMGSLCVAGPIQLQMPVIERACEVSRGADRVEMLRFACQFSEFGGWIFQDAGDLTCAMQWTNRALDYALELGDERVIAYTLMRKAMIATESGSPAQGLGIADAALKRKNALTPRLRAVILRQRSYSNAVLGELIGFLLWAGPYSSPGRGVLTSSLDPATLGQCLVHLDALAALRHRPPALHRPDIVGRLSLLFGQLGQAVTQDRTSRREDGVTAHPAVVRAMALLEADLAGDWTLTGLAAELHLAPGYLVRLFNAATGLPLMAYLAQLRAEHAAVLLLPTDEPVTSIGRTVGWPDQNMFAHRFKAHYGLSATTYRKRFATRSAHTHHPADPIVAAS